MKWRKTVQRWSLHTDCRPSFTADNIIVLDKGGIAEQGNHGELLEKGGLYAGLWSRQRQVDEARETLAHVLDE